MGKGLEPKIAEKLSAAINSCKQANMIAMELGAVPRYGLPLGLISRPDPAHAWPTSTIPIQDSSTAGACLPPV